MVEAWWLIASSNLWVNVGLILSLYRGLGESTIIAHLGVFDVFVMENAVFSNKRTVGSNLIQVVIELYDACLSQADSAPVDASPKIGKPVFDARA